MALPSWLAGLTGANKFANNPANGFQATLGDMAQAAGHSMLQHYRGKGGTYGGPTLIEGLNAGPGLSTPMPTLPGETATRVPVGPAITGQPLPPTLALPQAVPPQRVPAAPAIPPVASSLPGWGAIGIAQLLAGLRGR